MGTTVCREGRKEGRKEGMANGKKERNYRADNANVGKTRESIMPRIWPWHSTG
jgi:hypothetical protein